MPGDDKNRGQKGKVTPLEARRLTGRDWEAESGFDSETLDELLGRMRKVREAIPVNSRLREELRARLLRMQAGSAAGGSVPPAAAAGTDPAASLAAPRTMNLSKLFLLLPALALLMALAWLWWSAAAPKSLEAGSAREVSRFWQEESPLEFASLPENRGYLAVRNGALQLLDQNGSQAGTVKPGRGQRLASPALTGDGGRLALVRSNSAGGDEIISLALPQAPLEAGVARQVEAALAGARVLLKTEAGESLSGLTWSPDGKTLAYTLNRPGEESEIFLWKEGGDEMSLGPGRRPAWSPDGSRLAVERVGDSGEPEIWLIGPVKGEYLRLTEGEQPAWAPQGHLAFIRARTTERVLTYSPEGSPLFTVRQRQGEIRAVNLSGSNDVPQEIEGYLRGERLLLAPDHRPGVDELNWLRRLEFEGVREPRTLLVDQASDFQGMKFAPDGKSLLLARRDGTIVSLLQLNLRERISRQGDK